MLREHPPPPQRCRSSRATVAVAPTIGGNPVTAGIMDIQVLNQPGDHSIRHLSSPPRDHNRRDHRGRHHQHQHRLLLREPAHRPAGSRLSLWLRVLQESGCLPVAGLWSGAGGSRDRTRHCSGNTNNTEAGKTGQKNRHFFRLLSYVL